MLNLRKIYHSLTLKLSKNYWGKSSVPHFTCFFTATRVSGKYLILKRAFERKKVFWKCSRISPILWNYLTVKLRNFLMLQHFSVTFQSIKKRKNRCTRCARQIFWKFHGFETIEFFWGSLFISPMSSLIPAPTVGRQIFGKSKNPRERQNRAFSCASII